MSETIIMRSLSAAAVCLLAAHVASAQSITILHSSDGESQLINAGSGLEDFGGVARFKTVVDNLRADATLAGEETILISAGDTILPGPELNASLANGVPFFDGIALDAIGFDALIIGNHEFDLGPSVFRDLIDSTTSVPFVSANLNFAGEPALAPLDGVRLFDSVVLNRDGEDFGIIGVTTENLPFITSPGGVTVDPNLVSVVQNEINNLIGSGVSRIILVGHLQSLSEQIALTEALTGVDVSISGGGGELLANPGDALVPGDAAFDQYPLTTIDAGGRTVQVVSTQGDYRYVGRLAVTFDAAGEVASVDPTSGPVRVAGGGQPDAVAPDATVQANVVDPVADFIADLASTIIATSEVELDGLRSNIRSRETNEGNLVADSFIWQANQVAGDFGLPEIDVAVTNGGGIRNDSIIPTGDFSLLSTFDILPFTNFIAVFPDLPADTLLDVLENAYSRLDVPDGFPTDGSGRFAQVGGLKVQYNIDVNPGEGRVRRVMLNDGTEIIRNGRPVWNAPTVTLATVDFLARGGDEYPFGDAPFTIVGFTYQLSLANYISSPAGLDGVISAADYPAGGEGRITKTSRDLNGDGVVNIFDFFQVLSNWGFCDLPCPEDLNGNGRVGIFDLIDVILNFS